MTLTFRRTLALLFAGLFIAVAGLAVAYGRGYRYDPQTHQVRLTGVIAIAGSPRQVYIAMDDGPQKRVTLPYALRGLSPATHALTVQAKDYMSQTFTIAVRSGETHFLTALQLYRKEPYTTLRTAIPKTGVLAPDGSMVAWIAGQQLTLATESTLTRVPLPEGALRATWSDDAKYVFALTETDERVAVYDRDGKMQTVPNPYIPPEHTIMKQLVDGRLAYTTIQNLPGGTGWLLGDSTAAWLLDRNGELTLATRWGTSVIGVFALNQSTIATVRRTEISLRNLANVQTATYALPETEQAAGSTQAGELHFLITDGDLLTWVRGVFF